MAPATFQELLAPASASEFFSDIWGKTFRHYPGSRGRLAELFSWSSLNDILRFHRLDSPRVRLAKEGKTLSPDTLLRYESTRRDPFVRIPRLNTGALTRSLRDGATLILDAVDDMHASVSVLTEDLETVFRVRPQVNLYAGWRTSQGFDVHWDDHDVLIAQVAGRKRWTVYGATTRYPLARDKNSQSMPPTEPVWEGLLEDGDLLYIPRGWWHVAVPLDEPTLHLTIGFSNPTGIDLLQWFVDCLSDCESLRRDVPIFADQTEQSDYVQELRASLDVRLYSGLIGEYLAFRDARTRPRPHPALPWTAEPSGLPQNGGEWKVRWIAPRPAAIVSEADDVAIALSCNGRSLRFAAAARPLLETLMTRRPLLMSDLCAAAPDIPRERIERSIREMIDEELVCLC